MYWPAKLLNPQTTVTISHEHQDFKVPYSRFKHRWKGNKKMHPFSHKYFLKFRFYQYSLNSNMIADANILTFLISCSTLFLFVHLLYHILANFGGKKNLGYFGCCQAANFRTRLEGLLSYFSALCFVYTW